MTYYSLMKDLGLVVSLVVLFHVRLSDFRLSLFYRKEFLFLFLFVFFTLLSLMINGYYQDLISSCVQFYWIVFLYSLGLFFHLSKRALPAFFVGLLTGIYLASFNSIVQWITGLNIYGDSGPVRFTAKSHEFVIRVIGFFHNPNPFGYSLSMALMVPIAFFFLRKPIRQKLMISLIFLMGFFSFVLTYSRGAWISFICSCLCFFLVY